MDIWLEYVESKTSRSLFKGKDWKGVLKISLRHLLYNQVEISCALLDV